MARTPDRRRLGRESGRRGGSESGSGSRGVGFRGGGVGVGGGEEGLGFEEGGVESLDDGEDVGACDSIQILIHTCACIRHVFVLFKVQSCGFGLWHCKQRHIMSTYCMNIRAR